MALSSSGMKAAIIDELPGDPDMEAGQADVAIEAVAIAVCAEIASNGTGAVTTDSSGTCGNLPGPPPTPGPYAGTGSASAAGSISGLSSSGLTSAIKAQIESLLSGVDWTKGSQDKPVEAMAEAIVEEIHSNGKITVTTAETGVVAAGGGPVTGSGTGVGTVVGLSASGLHTAIKSKLTSKLGAENVNFDVAGVDDQILAIATGVVNHVHAAAIVTVATDLSTITCPPTGGSPTATSADSTSVVVS